MKYKILALLPKTDCQKCGHSTCHDFAGTLAQRKASLESCPDIATETKKIVHEIMSFEREMARKIGGIKTSSVKEAFQPYVEVFVMFPVKVISSLLFTFPLSAPIVLFVIWLFYR